ncbi:hypothetical protein DPMN_060622 [Dreissena polymorpha]|uniref:Uncharacterized protein n=1 Tax=Dreissena polymorpha TaxID=45954 RepID=A0A9D4C670_DREPO|nr:hypothetical protein DPMN_060622 [Dreissena polymorpha]
MDKQFHQLQHQVQALQVPRSLPPTVRLRDLDVVLSGVMYIMVLGKVSQPYYC